MEEIVMTREQQSGETCGRCECELVLVSTEGESELYIECDCGVVACIGPLDTRRLSAAA